MDWDLKEYGSTNKTIFGLLDLRIFLPIYPTKNGVEEQNPVGPRPKTL